MSAQDPKHYFQIQARKFALARLIEVKFVALGMGLLGFALVRAVAPDFGLSLLVGAILFVVVLILRIRRTGALKWNSLRVSLYLNANFPELKDSADLLVKDKLSSPLEAVQRERVLGQLDTLKPRVRPPHRIGQSLMVFLTGMLAVVFLPAAKSRTLATAASTVDTTAVVSRIPALRQIEVMVSPPRYTGIRPFSVLTHDFKVPSYSKQTGEVSFTGDAIRPALVFSATDSLLLTSQKNYFQATSRAVQPALYQVTWRDASGKRHASDYFHADTKEDAPPAIAVVGRQQFQVLKPGDSMQFIVAATVTDDYAVKEAHLVATVSKGSGEGIKFREVIMPFSEARFPAKGVELRQRIDLAQLGLEPGDELYFYAEAVDSKMPAPNLARTETFFVALEDTAEAVTVADSGLGIDLMPDYFRSQRQLIIDTEKLLAEQRKIKKTDFNFRSNELGFDQKALRLKYGQFLGMEDELGIGVVEPTAEDEEEDPMAKFGHQHDKENEHNLVEEKKQGKETEHKHEAEPVDGADEDPMKAFLHQHDSEDEATFFIQSVKAKLKAALTLMWDSELHLRMYEPKKSLPYQYRILALLKEIAQDNRAYVHRTGFDAPPVKEERRLTGELEEAAGTTEQVMVPKANRYPAIQAAVVQVESLLQEPATLTQQARLTMKQAGYEVASEAIRHPGRYMKTLSSLQKLAEGSLEATETRRLLLEVRADLWFILPAETYAPTRKKRALHPLDQEVLELMEKSRE